MPLALGLVGDALRLAQGFKLGALFVAQGGVVVAHWISFLNVDGPL